jgi:hypothetical protein
MALPRKQKVASWHLEDVHQLVRGDQPAARGTRERGRRGNDEEAKEAVGAARGDDRARDDHRGGVSLLAGEPPPERYIFNTHDRNSQNSCAQDSNASVNGFNLYDISSVACLAYLPSGTQALFWTGGYNDASSVCDWYTSWSNLQPVIQDIVNNHGSQVWGFLNADEPNLQNCPGAVAQVKARYDDIRSVTTAKPQILTIHAQDASQRAEMSLWAAQMPLADYVGIVAYPCRDDVSDTCTSGTYQQIVDAKNAASANRLPWMPVVQAFSGSNRPHYLMPTCTQLKGIINTWTNTSPTPNPWQVMMTYAWWPDPASGNIGMGDPVNGSPQDVALMRSFNLNQRPTC